MSSIKFISDPDAHELVDYKVDGEGYRTGYGNQDTITIAVPRNAAGGFTYKQLRSLGDLVLYLIKHRRAILEFTNRGSDKSLRNWCKYWIKMFPEGTDF